jgi:hypothetical protein
VSDDLSDFGRLNVIHADLIRKRNAATDQIERPRLNTLIANAVELKRNPDNAAARKQFGRNAADLAKYLAERK